MMSSLTCTLKGVMEEIQPYLHPFGNTPAHNILEGFDGSEPVEDDGTGLTVK